MSESESIWSAFFRTLGRIFGGTPPPPPPPPPPADTGELVPMQPRVLAIVYNPVVDMVTGKKLIEAMQWNNPSDLMAGYIADVSEASGGLVNYQIVDTIEANEIPIKLDGFRYSPQTYMNVARSGIGAHDPDAVDYNAILMRHNILDRVAAKEFDEVWLFGGPYFGFWESAMAGAGAFFSNGGPIANTAQCPRKFLVMGFNYQRGVGEMLEDISHRAESILARLFHAEQFLGWAYTLQRSPRTVTNANPTLFERFMYFDQIAPGKANIGTVHYAPNSLADYQWGIATPVLACADDWYQFPNLPTPPNYHLMDARDWGNGDIRAHHKWWLRHLPKATGVTNNIANNWWKYFIDPNNVK